MSNSDQPVNDGQQLPPARKSGQIGRLLFLLIGFGILAGGIWGYRTYLDSLIPERDPNVVKPGFKEDGPPPSGIEVLSEMLAGSGPSKEVEELKKMKADEVAFTYDAIMKMTPDELKKNIDELSARLERKREALPPSFGGASAGGPPEANPSGEAGEKDTATIAFIALPLEVMRQVRGD